MPDEPRYEPPNDTAQTEKEVQINFRSRMLKPGPYAFYMLRELNSTGPNSML